MISLLGMNKPRQPVSLAEVARIAERVVARTAGEVSELAPRGSVRTFHVKGAADVVVRVDEDPAGGALATENDVLQALATATVPALGPQPLAFSSAEESDHGRTHLVYEWVRGSVLDAGMARMRARDLGVAFARLHGARVMDLWDRLPRVRALTLMEAYRKAVEEMKAWLLARELDGLAQDLLTLALSDLQRALRPYCLAQDHSFLLGRRRVLCHGRLSPGLCVAKDEANPVAPIAVVGFDEASLGDAAEDLASFALAAELDEHAEEAMLNAYLGELDELRRPDAHFVSRYFARRALLLFSIPIARLARMTRVKRGDAVILRDPVVEIEEEAKRTYEELSRAMNGLRDLGGRARPVGANEVAAMGRLVAIEEMILHDRTFRIAVSGRPYVGKTEIASQLARRLRHRFVPTTALSRGLALAEQRLADQGRPAGSLREAVTALFAAPFVIAPSPEPPFYKATLAGENVTQALHAGGALAVRAAALLDDDELRVMLRDALHADLGTAGLVVEGPYAHALATAGGVRAHAFHLDADAGVRRARLSAHRADLETDDAAAELLSRLDEASTPPPQDAVVVDVGSRTAAAATLELLWHLLPPGRRPQEDLTGRTPL